MIVVRLQICPLFLRQDSSCSPIWSDPCDVDQAGLKPASPCASVSGVGINGDFY